MTTTKRGYGGRGSAPIPDASTLDLNAAHPARAAVPVRSPASTIRSRLACSLAVLGLAAGCGPTSVATRSASAALPAPSERAARELPPEEPAAPGAQLAGGRLGSLLDGLAPSDASLPGVFGDSGSGPDAPSMHLLAHTTDAGDQTLRVVAWDTFAPAPSHDVVAALRRVLEDDAAAPLETADPELSAVATFPPLEQPYARREPEATLASDEEARFLVQLAVAVRGGSIVRITVVCQAGAACRAEHRDALAADLARSLRRGPRLRGGGEWALRLPRGDADARVTISLPPGFVGLSLRMGGEVRVAPVIALASGREALRVEVAAGPSSAEWVLTPGAPLPGPDPGGDADLECAPFSCVARFDEGSRALLLDALASARVEPLPLEDELVPIAAAGRLSILLPGPSIVVPAPWDPDIPRDSAIAAWVETRVRFGAAVVALSARETLEPTDDVLARARQYASERAAVDRVDAGDASLAIARVLSTSSQGEQFIRLFVAETEGTTLEVGATCATSDPCHADPDAFSRELARRLRRGAPLRNDRVLRFRLAGRLIELELPEGYVVTSWYVSEHDAWGITATHIHLPAATLEIEDAGGMPDAWPEDAGRRTGRRTTLRLGAERVPMIERLGDEGSRIWGADLCEGAACSISVRTASSEERDRLLAALAAARVTRDPPCLRGFVRDDDYLNVRAAPSVRAPVVGRVTTEAITIAETRGRWSRITAPVAGWAWDESIGRDCH